MRAEKEVEEIKNNLESLLVKVRKGELDIPLLENIRRTILDIERIDADLGRELIGKWRTIILMLSKLVDMKKG